MNITVAVDNIITCMIVNWVVNVENIDDKMYVYQLIDFNLMKKMIEVDRKFWIWFFKLCSLGNWEMIMENITNQERGINIEDCH